VTVSWSTSADDVLHAFLEVHPATDTRDKIKLLAQFDALIRGGWAVDEVAAAAGRFAATGGEPSQFARWASRTRPRTPWWIRD
jgi:hypothetical protein